MTSTPALRGVSVPWSQLIVVIRRKCSLILGKRSFILEPWRPSLHLNLGWNKARPDSPYLTLRTGDSRECVHSFTKGGWLLASNSQPSPPWIEEHRFMTTAGTSASLFPPPLNNVIKISLFCGFFSSFSRAFIFLP